MDYRDQLRLLAINDAQFRPGSKQRGTARARRARSQDGGAHLHRRADRDGRGGAVVRRARRNGFGERGDGGEIVDVLVAAIPIIGLPGVVAEAPKLALALGYDTEEALEQPSGP